MALNLTIPNLPSAAAQSSHEDYDTLIELARDYQKYKSRSEQETANGCLRLLMQKCTSLLEVAEPMS